MQYIAGLIGDIAAGMQTASTSGLKRCQGRDQFFRALCKHGTDGPGVTAGRSGGIAGIF